MKKLVNIGYSRIWYLVNSQISQKMLEKNLSKIILEQAAGPRTLELHAVHITTLLVKFVTDSTDSFSIFSIFSMWCASSYTRHYAHYKRNIPMDFFFLC